jgi:predicted nucleic acid-binding protein
MRAVELIADTNVVSYMHNRVPLGLVYEELIGSRRVGLAGCAIAELRAGAINARWGERRLRAQQRFLDQFSHVPDTREMAELCGAIRAERSRIGKPIDWPDAWTAACALWLEVPLVTHDRDHEAIPGLRVLTAHSTWRVRETDCDVYESGPLFLSEGPTQSWHLRAMRSAHQ